MSIPVRTDCRPLSPLLQQYEITEQRQSNDQLRVVVTLPGQASVIERVYLAPRGYNRRALLWCAHNSINASPRRSVRFPEPRHPEGTAHWRARLDDLAKRAGWEPYSEGDYKIPIGVEPGRHGHPADIYSVVGVNGFGFVARICSTGTGAAHFGETIRTGKSSVLAGWLYRKRIQYRDGDQ